MPKYMSGDKNNFHRQPISPAPFNNDEKTPKPDKTTCFCRL